MQRFQTRVSTTLATRWELIAVVLAAVVGGRPGVRRPAAAAGTDTAGAGGAGMSGAGLSEEIPLRPAATVMLVRDAEGGGIEVFMVRRATSAAFAGGMYVFPGGRVDDADGASGAATFVAGLDDAAASATLGLPSGGLAYWVAAIRECFEEAGLLLACSSGGGDAPGDSPTTGGRCTVASSR